MANAFVLFLSYNKAPKYFINKVFEFHILILSFHKKQLYLHSVV